jgi:hypothetical protein
MISRSLLVGLVLLAGCETTTTTDKSSDGVVQIDTDSRDTAISFDNDNSFADANQTDDFAWDNWVLYPIADGARLYPAGDRDFYQIEVEEGEIFQAYTSSYQLLGQVIADTVLRLYDQDENLITTNDDMIFRYWETDSNLFWQAEYTGSYYLEVLEWADWAGEQAQGGPDYEYDLLVAKVETTEHEGSNDTRELVDGDATIEKEGVFAGSAVSDYSVEFYGMMDNDADVDIYPIEVPADGFAAVYGFSLWPECYGKLAPKMDLYDDDWTLLASTTDPAPVPEFTFLWDMGIIYKLQPSRTYYLALSDTEGNSGSGTFYPGEFHSYVEDFAATEQEGNDTLNSANELTYEESTTTAGFYSARLAGSMPAGDDADVFEINTDDLPALQNQYLTVLVQGQSVGSLLDAKFTIVDENDEEIVVASSDPETGSADPGIRDLELMTDGPYFVRVEAESRGEDGSDLAQSWFLVSYVSDEPVYAE